MPPKVTIRHEPHAPAAAGKKTSSLVHVTDSRGRRLGLRQLPFLEEFRIVEAMGPELSANTTYMNMLNPLLYLAEVDGTAIDVPATKLAAEALIQLAGREGFVAVLEGIAKHFAVDPKTTEARIKNGEGTQDSETVSGS